MKSIHVSDTLSFFDTSHPSRVCGLKLTGTQIKKSKLTVAPFAGVWIEIKNREKAKQRLVAPFAGVWIEITSASCGW